MFLPVHLANDPEGLEDNYAFTDGQCDWKWGITQWMKEWEEKKREVQPFGYQDINDYCGQSVQDASLI